MKFKKPNPFKLTSIVVLFAVVASLSAFLLFEYIQQQNAFEVDKYLSSLEKEDEDVFEHIRANVEDIIEQGGVEGVTVLTKEAFKKDLITMYECHTLAHIIGHNSDLDLISSENVLKKIGVNFCEGGFKHGVAAEITLRGLYEGKDFRDDLYSFCEFLLAEGESIGSDCYHGSGHEFMGQTVDIQEALDMCETLTGGPIQDQDQCYKGVFSEYTNLLGGVDGETGYLLTSGPPVSIDVHPIEFCSSFEEKYQLPCALEVSGFNRSHHASEEDLVNSLVECTIGDFDEKIKEACVRSVAAVSTQNDLPHKDTIIPPQEVLEWPENYRRYYIDGAGTEMLMFVINGSNKDWRKFCDSFANDDRQFCNSIFES